MLMMLSTFGNSLTVPSQNMWDGCYVTCSNQTRLKGGAGIGICVLCRLASWPSTIGVCVCVCYVEVGVGVFACVCVCVCVCACACSHVY